MALSVDELQQELDRLRGAAGGAAGAVGQFGSALTGAAGGLGGYNRMLQGTSQALGGLVKDIPLAQAGITGLSKGLGTSLDMTDRLNRVYMALGNTGQSLGETQESLREQGDRFGLAIGLNEAAAQLFAKTMTANSKDLARLGGTAVLGSRRLGEAFEAMGPVRVALQNIGIAYEEQIEGLAAFTRLQTASGRAQNMSTQQLAQGAADYLRKLQDLAAVTGVSRQEQMKAQEAARAEQRFGAMVIGEERRARELERQGRTAEAAAIRKNIQELENFNGVVAGMDEEMAKGLRDMAAGAVNTPEARKVARSLGGDAQAIVQGLKRGTLTSEQALQRLGQASDRHVARTNKLAQVSGSYSDQLLSQQGSERVAQLARNRVDQRALEAAEARRKAEQNLTTDVAKTNIASNKLRQAQVEAGKVMEGTSEAGLAAADAIGTKLLEVLPSVVDQFNQLSTSLTNTVQSSNTFGEFLQGILKAGADFATPAATPGGARSAEDVRKSADALRRRLEEPNLGTQGQRSATQPQSAPRSDVMRLPQDQVQALRDTTANLTADQLSALKPVTLPATQDVKIAPDQIRDLKIPSLATPGFATDRAPQPIDDAKMRTQAADITRRYMDLAGDLGLDRLRQMRDSDKTSRYNIDDTPRLDISRLGDMAANQPNAMRIKMPELALPAAPTTNQTDDQRQQIDQNFRNMIEQVNARPEKDDLAPLMSVMTDMLNVQRQQSATMTKMLQAQRN